MIAKLFKNKWLFSIYLIVIILLVTLPINSAAGELNNITIITFRGDYFFHALAFLPWAFFRASTNYHRINWLMMGILFAASTEALQYLLPYRAYNVNDSVANMLGVIVGFVVSNFALRINKLTSQSKP